MLTINPEDIQAKNHDIVLDLGCGEGRHTIGFSIEKQFYQQEKLILLGQDIGGKDLLTAKMRLKETRKIAKSSNAATDFIRSDIFALPHKDETVDHIICSEVLEHLVDYHKALNEMNRILKPGGTLAISVPRGWSERICWKFSKAYYQVPGGHVRIFDHQALKKEIRDKGFVMKKIYGKHALHMPYWWLRCFFWSKGDSFFLIKAYHKLLVWDLFKKPWLTRHFDKVCNPWLGKSVVMIFKKETIQA